MTNMRKVKIDARILGILSARIFPLPTFARDPTILLKWDSSGVGPYLCSTDRYFHSHSKLNRLKTMDDDSDAEYFANGENCKRRASTLEDEQLVVKLLKEVIEYRMKNVSSWIVEVSRKYSRNRNRNKSLITDMFQSKLRTLCEMYKYLLKPHKSGLITVLAKDYAVDHRQICIAAKALLDNQMEGELKVAKSEEHLRNLLTPEYSWMFMHIGRLEHGVKFLVDLRTDVLELATELGKENPETVHLEQLSNTLKELLSMWFSVGFLHLERVTWRSSCEMLQKISEYEAVHPVRSWTDLKRRVGPYRRCFVFLHSSMPDEPLVVLHTALCDEISTSMKGIVSARSRMSVDASAGQDMLVDAQQENPQQVKAAIFYSITSTQKGLQGIELGNYLIKKVVDELQQEFPHATLFSSLSPIPAFKGWLMDKLKMAEKGQTDVLTVEELTKLQTHLKSDNVWKDLKRLIHSNQWADDIPLVSLLQLPLMRLCARYLFLEKRRGYALDNVANFHLRNGAVMWRLNWQADLSPRGMTNSCGIMVNYRYFLEATEANSRTYLEQHVIEASPQVQALADQAQQLMVMSKM